MAIIPQPRLPEGRSRLIAQSHERCAALGLSRIERPDFAPLGRSDLTVVRERNQRLHAHAAPVMDLLFDQILGTQSMVVLCDATGTILHSVGDDDFLERASKVALHPGVNWSEPSKGTNAIGTALVEERPTLVHADEHYMHANSFLTCSAAPILDPRGNILGVLDVTGDHRSYHPHTMALVRMSARMIENHWLSDDHRHALRLHFHARADFLGTLMEGILAVAPDGRIVGANRGALELLDLSGAALRMHSLPELFGTTVEALVDRFRHPMAVPLAVRTDAGQAFFLHARFDWPVFGPAVAPAVVRPAEPAPPALPATPLLPSLPPGPGLDELQTGDARMHALVDKLRRVLDRELPILLLGETGTGKDLLAQALHRASPRARGAFVAVNCAALPAGESALAARLRQAEGGTLYLDGIGELPEAAQALLLQALQDRPLAVVCAARQGLQDRMTEGRFREDLYYRLEGLVLRLPPLRERSDLAALARRLLDADPRSRALHLTPDALARLQAQPWPGNLRQLAHVLRAAAALAGDGPAIGPEHLPEEFAGTPAAQSLDELESQAIRRAVDAEAGNISAAARRLGVSRNTVYRRLRAR